MNYSIIVIVSLLSGIIIGLLIGRRRQNRLLLETQLLKQQNSNLEQTQRTALQQASEQLHNQELLWQQRLDQSRQEWEQMSDRLIGSLKEHHLQEMAQQQQRFESTSTKMMTQLELETNKILKDRQAEFAQGSQQSFDRIVTPLKETMEQMRRALNENALSQKEMGGAIKTHMEQMVRQSEAAQRSAEELTRVFKHQTKVQGDWGELILDELLSKEGLQSGINYELQCILRDDDGRTIKPLEGQNLRPDVILHLDQDRDVIIDSKVSLKSYMDYVNASDDNTRSQALKSHVSSLKRHVDELAHKDYSTYHTKSKIDFVIMFVPHAAALWLAMSEEPLIWRQAMEKKVYIADDHTLYAALKIIRLTWTQIEQQHNQEQLYHEASLMLDRVGTFLRYFEEMGREIQKMQECYQNGQRLLADNGASIPTSAKKMISLGVKNKNVQNKIPSQYLSD